MRFSWLFIGYSTPYQIFSGAMETVAGLLLLNRRTVTAGLFAATGAFCYPNDRWNTQPVDVDLHHERLWDWRDLQITRCWRQGMSPQNFGLLE